MGDLRQIVADIIDKSMGFEQDRKEDPSDLYHPWTYSLADQILAAIDAAQPGPHEVVPEWVEMVDVTLYGDPITPEYGSYQRQMEGTGSTINEAIAAALAQDGGEHE